MFFIDPAFLIVSVFVILLFIGVFRVLLLIVAPTTFKNIFRIHLSKKIAFVILSLMIIILIYSVMWGIKEETRVEQKVEVIRIMEWVDKLTLEDKDQFLNAAKLYLSSMDKENIDNNHVRKTWISSLLKGVEKGIIDVKDVSSILVAYGPLEKVSLNLIGNEVIEYYQLKYGDKKGKAGDTPPVPVPDSGDLPRQGDSKDKNEKKR